MDGLHGIQYMDSLQDRARLPQRDASVRFAGEVDRVYLDTPDTLEVAMRSAALLRSLPSQQGWWEGAVATCILDMRG